MRNVFVTGGGSGIGLAIACAFRDAGHPVKICGRDEAKLAASGLPYVVLNVCNPEALASALNKSAPIDIFIANAGGAETAPALKTSRALWEEMLALNLTSVFDCARAAVPSMIERKWGRFIVIGSTASLKGFRYASAYAAAKHGVLGFVRSLALELAGTGVTANALCPGYTDTPMVAAAIGAISAKTGRTRDAAAAALAIANPMKRLLAPSEIATAALWLASDDAGSVNGQAIAIDGGETA